MPVLANRKLELVDLGRQRALDRESETRTGSERTLTLTSMTLNAWSLRPVDSTWILPEMPLPPMKTSASPLSVILGNPLFFLMSVQEHSTSARIRTRERRVRTESDVLQVGLNLRERDPEAVLVRVLDGLVRRDLEVVTRLDLDDVGQELQAPSQRSTPLVGRMARNARSRSRA